MTVTGGATRLHRIRRIGELHTFPAMNGLQEALQNPMRRGAKYPGALRHWMMCLAPHHDFGRQWHAASFAGPVLFACFYILN